MALPDSQRGPQHRDAKQWVLIAPDGIAYRIINLMDWAREHADWFDIVQDDADRERIARNIRSGFGQIVRSMKQLRKHPVYTYKGWRLGDWPREKAIPNDVAESKRYRQKLREENAPEREKNAPEREENAPEFEE